jgi:hypothetical protein
MSSTFTLHLPKSAVPGEPGALERAEIVRDGFSWGAFLVPGVWFLWHRHLGLCVLAFAVVLGSFAGMVALRLPGGAVLLVQLLIHLFFGLEGASLRRLAYRLRGRLTAGVVIAADEAEAESKSFARWLEPETFGAAPIPVPAPAAVRVAPAIRQHASEPVIGLFPDAERRR